MERKTNFKLPLPLYEASLGDGQEELTGVNFISVVEKPAIGLPFVALQEEPMKPYLCLHKASAGAEELHYLTGPVLLPNQPIYRKGAGPDDSAFYLLFRKEEVRRIAERYLQKNEGPVANHEHFLPLHAVSLAESWLVTDGEKDKSAALGLGPFPAGTWMLSLKVDDLAYWQQEIAKGGQKGFSLEGHFELNELQPTEIPALLAEVNLSPASASNPQGSDTLLEAWQNWWRKLGSLLHQPRVPVAMTASSERAVGVKEVKTPKEPNKLQDLKASVEEISVQETKEHEQCEALKAEHALLKQEIEVLKQSLLKLEAHPAAVPIEKAHASAKAELEDLVHQETTAERIWRQLQAQQSQFSVADYAGL